MKICKSAKYFKIGIALMAALLAGSPCYGADELVVTEDGKVGIGITSPGTVLSIKAQGQMDGLWIGPPDGSAKSVGLFNDMCQGCLNPLVQDGDRMLLWSSDQIGIPYDPTARGMVIGPWSNSPLGIRIGHDGRVGIGTPSPQAKLHVQCDAATLETVKQGGLTIENLLTAWGTPSKANISMGWFYEGGAFAMIQVNDSGYFLFKEDGTFYESSDERLKEDIQDLSGSLDRIMQLRSVKYKFKVKDDQKYAKTEQRYQVGFLAQQVETIYPEMVFTDADGNKSVAYTRMVAPLADAVTELKTLIDDLEATKADIETVEALKAENKALKEKNMAMQKNIDGILKRLAALEKK